MRIDDLIVTLTATAAVGACVGLALAWLHRIAKAAELAALELKRTNDRHDQEMADRTMIVAHMRSLQEAAQQQKDGVTKQ